MLSDTIQIEYDGRSLTYTPEWSILPTRVYIYDVPASYSEDGFYISLQPIGTIKHVPASSPALTTLLADYTHGDESGDTVHYLHEGVTNA